MKSSGDQAAMLLVLNCATKPSGWLNLSSAFFRIGFFYKVGEEYRDEDANGKNPEIGKIFCRSFCDE